MYLKTLAPFDFCDSVVWGILCLLFVYILSFGAFVLGTSEFMVAGMMPSLMSAFSISEEMAGGLVSLYALGMVVGGPVLAWVLTREGVPEAHMLGAYGDLCHCAVW